MAKKVWSSERSSQLLQMYHSGEFNTREMANKIGVTQRTIYNQLQSLGLGTACLPRRHKAPRKEEFSYSEKQKIRDLAEEGKYVTEIADTLGRTRTPVRRVFKELGLVPSNMKPLKVGMRFGYLVVVSPAPPEKTYKGYLESRSLVRCHCGSEMVVFNYNLRSGNTRTCGCKRHLINRETPYIRIFHQYLGGARSRGLEYRLSVAQIECLASMDCFYCGAPPSNNQRGRRGGRSTVETELAYTGVDRISSESGYQPGNVLPACWICNRAKGDMKLSEFVVWLNRLGKVIDKQKILDAAIHLAEHLEFIDSAPLFR